MENQPPGAQKIRRTSQNVPGRRVVDIWVKSRQIKEELREENLQWEGNWEQVKAAPHKYKWGTDGTAGASKDPRMQCHVWGVAVATVRDQEINVVASVSGRLMGPTKQCIDQKREPYSLLLNINGNRCWMSRRIARLYTSDCNANP